MASKDVFGYNGIDLTALASEMALHARDELGFLGAAVINLVTVIDKEKGEISIKPGEHATRLSRPSQPETRGLEDKGTNYLGHGQGKSCQAFTPGTQY